EKNRQGDKYVRGNPSRGVLCHWSAGSRAIAAGSWSRSVRRADSRQGVIRVVYSRSPLRVVVSACRVCPESTSRWGRPFATPLPAHGARSRRRSHPLRERDFACHSVLDAVIRRESAPGESASLGAAPLQGFAAGRCGALLRAARPERVESRGGVVG